MDVNKSSFYVSIVLAEKPDSIRLRNLWALDPALQAVKVSACVFVCMYTLFSCFSQT